MLPAMETPYMPLRTERLRWVCAVRRRRYVRSLF
jgi:hypothetical protein